MASLQKITPCLWFDTQAEEAANFYVSLFENSRIVRILHYADAGQEIHGKEAGSVLTVVFELDGQRFTALNGGPQFKFSEAISLEVACDTQEEIDYFWEALTQDGEEGECGWLKDKFGLSWQINLATLGEMLGDPDPEKTKRVTTVLLKMKKLDVAALTRAFAGQ
jgi:predicted 3-demethylubiquinone-9 3-methyltransferase (glyoxalase superfamily)